MEKSTRAILFPLLAMVTALAAAPSNLVLAGQDVSEQELAQKLRLYESIHTLEVSFTQTKVIRDIDVKLSSQGRFKITRPSKIVWEIIKPSPVRVTMDKTEVRIETGSGAEQHTQVLKLGDSLPDKAAKSLTGLIAWLNLDAKVLYAQYAISRAGEQSFHFEPRQREGSPFQDLLMVMGSGGHLKHLTIHEISGDTLDIEFGRPKIR